MADVTHRYALLFLIVLFGRGRCQRGLGRQGGCVNALLAQSQMADNLLRRLGKHWQIHPGRSGCQLEDISVFGVPVQGAEQSREVRHTSSGQQLLHGYHMRTETMKRTAWAVDVIKFLKG